MVLARAAAPAPIPNEGAAAASGTRARHHAPRPEYCWSRAARTCSRPRFTQVRAVSAGTPCESQFSAAGGPRRSAARAPCDRARRGRSPRRRSGGARLLEGRHLGGRRRGLRLRRRALALEERAIGGAAFLGKIADHPRRARRGADRRFLAFAPSSKAKFPGPRRRRGARRRAGSARPSAGGGRGRGSDRGGIGLHEPMFAPGAISVQRISISARLRPVPRRRSHVEAPEAATPASVTTW